MGRTTSRLDEKDVRAVVRLLGKVAGTPGNLQGKRRILMNGLAKLVGADGWLWTMTRLDHTGKVPVSLGVIHEGLSAEQIAGWLESSQATNPPLPEHERLRQLSMEGKHFTRTRQQLVTDAQWYSNQTVQQFRLNLGIDHFLYTIYPFESGLMSAIGMYRRNGRPGFSANESKIAHIVTSEVLWLHEATDLPSDARAATRLSPRLRTVLILMLDGKTRKEVAGLLSISPNTVRDHMEMIYRHFKVNSQIALIKRFTRGDGGDDLQS